MKKELFSIHRENFIFDHYIFKEANNSLFMAHSHNAYEIIFFLRGGATYVIEDKKYKLKKNDIVFIRPNKYHYIEIEPHAEYERYNILFTSNIIGLNVKQLIPHDLEIINCTDNVIFENFKKADYYNTQLSPDAFIDISKCLLKEILYNISFHVKDSVIPSVVSPLISKALKYINKNLLTIERISEISNELYITEAHFFKTFKEQLKISPKKYITDKRLLLAQKLINSGKKPTEVYTQCGFQTYTAFYKRYVQFFGHSPSNSSPSILPEDNQPLK